MKRMVRYKLKPDRVDENERLVRAVYQELAERRPPGLRYATFKLEDGLSFVHIASHEASRRQQPADRPARLQGLRGGRARALRRAARHGRAQRDRLLWLLRVLRRPRR